MYWGLAFGESTGLIEYYGIDQMGYFEGTSTYMMMMVVTMMMMMIVTMISVSELVTFDQDAMGRTHRGAHHDSGGGS